MSNLFDQNNLLHFYNMCQHKFFKQKPLDENLNGKQCLINGKELGFIKILDVEPSPDSSCQWT